MHTTGFFRPCRLTHLTYYSRCRLMFSWDEGFDGHVGPGRLPSARGTSSARGCCGSTVGPGPWLEVWQSCEPVVRPATRGSGLVWLKASRVFFPAFFHLGPYTDQPCPTASEALTKFCALEETLLASSLSERLKPLDSEGGWAVLFDIIHRVRYYWWTRPRRRKTSCTPLAAPPSSLQ